VTILTVDVGDFEIDHADAFFLDQIHDVLYTLCYGVSP